MPLSTESAAAVAALSAAPNKRAATRNCANFIQEHRTCVSAVAAQLLSLEEQLRAAKEETKAANEEKKVLGNSMLDYLASSDVMVKASDGSTCPAVKATLIEKADYFKGRLGSGAAMVDGEEVITFDDVSREAVAAFMLQLHMPGSGASTSPSVAFEVLDRLISFIGGPAAAEDPAAADDAMIQATSYFVNVFVQDDAGSVGADECHAFALALKRSLDRLDDTEIEPWLREGFEKVASKCAQVLREADTEAFEKDPAWLSVLSQTALLKVLDVKPRWDSHATYSFIVSWLKQAEESKVNETCIWEDGVTGFAAMKANLCSAQGYAAQSLSALMNLNQMMNGEYFPGETEDALHHWLTAFGLSTAGNRQALENRLNDAWNSTWNLVKEPDAEDAELAKLWELYVDSLVNEDDSEVSFATLAASPDWLRVDPASVSRMLSKESLNVTSEKVVVKAFLKWANASGREVRIIDRIAPLVRFPLVRVVPHPSEEIKTLLKPVYDRSEVVKALVLEAYRMQLKVGNAVDGPRAARASLTPKKHKLIDGEEHTVERHKRRKLCTNDEVPAIGIAAAVRASMA